MCFSGKQRHTGLKDFNKRLGAVPKVEMRNTEDMSGGLQQLFNQNLNQ